MIQIPLINYLFGGSLPIMGVFLTMVGLDLTTGYVKALKSHTWVSSNNLKDLFTKFVVGNDFIRDNKSYSFSCYDRIFVTMIRKLGGC
ncbi:phage holin family protein [Enterococcus avium]|uniref:phage holin family protein n=1 Tax=Enterococcus avium TaxID=33945 RepID=UPI0035D6FD0D